MAVAAEVEENDEDGSARGEGYTSTIVHLLHSLCVYIHLAMEHINEIHASHLPLHEWSLPFGPGLRKLLHSYSAVDFLQSRCKCMHHGVEFAQIEEHCPFEDAHHRKLGL